MPFPEAVECAVDYCTEKGILADFLSKNRVEAIAVSIFEYDEKKQEELKVTIGKLLQITDHRYRCHISTERSYIGSAKE